DDARAGRLDEPVGVGGGDAHHHPAPAARRDGHVAADEEREPAEHLLLGHVRLARGKLADPCRQRFVVCHSDEVRTREGSNPAMAQETQLLELAQRGDERAYVELVEPHRGALHAHCYRMLGSLEDADDALQDALLRAWRGLHAFERRSSVGTWLYAIA